MEEGQEQEHQKGLEVSRAKRLRSKSGESSKLYDLGILIM